MRADAPGMGTGADAARCDTNPKDEANSEAEAEGRAEVDALSGLSGLAAVKAAASVVLPLLAEPMTFAALPPPPPPAAPARPPGALGRWVPLGDPLRDPLKGAPRASAEGTRTTCTPDFRI